MLVHVSKNLDTLTLEFWAFWEHPPSSPECMLIRRQLLVHHSLVVLQWHPSLLRQSFATQTSPPCSVKTAWAPSRLLQRHLGVRLVLYTSEMLVLTPHFLRWQMSTNAAKWTFFLSPCASRITSFLLLTLSSCHAGTVSSFSRSLSTAAFAPGIFTAWGIGINLWTKLQCVSALSHLPAMWSSWSFGRDDPKRFLVDSWASTTHACLVFGILFNSPLLASVSWKSETLFAPNLQGIAASFGTSNFFCFFWSPYTLHLPGRNKDPSQFSNIVELWFFRPFLFLFLLSYFWHAGQNFRPQIIWCGSCLKLRKSPLRPHISFWRFFVQWSELRFASTFQQTSMRFACNTSRFL